MCIFRICLPVKNTQQVDRQSGWSGMNNCSTCCRRCLFGNCPARQSMSLMLSFHSWYHGATALVWSEIRNTNAVLVLQQQSRSGTWVLGMLRQVLPKQTYRVKKMQNKAKGRWIWIQEQLLAVDIWKWGFKLNYSEAALPPPSQRRLPFANWNFEATYFSGRLHLTATVTA